MSYSSTLNRTTTVNRYGVNNPATFQVTGRPQSRLGVVRAQARAPSGHSRNVEVVEKDGIYTVNFTPTESGQPDFFFRLFC